MLAEILIDDELWGSASRLRRDDWRVSISELLGDAGLGDGDDHRLELRRTADRIVCTTFDQELVPRGTHEVHDADLRPHVEEYTAIIRKLYGDDRDAPQSARMAAFDMAKKVVHDAAAKTLARAMPGLAQEHETYRRVFSLLYSIVIDVTVIPGAHAHRRHG